MGSSQNKERVIQTRSADDVLSCEFRKDKWFLFDDETVSAIEDLNAPSQYDQDDSIASVNGGSRKTPPLSAKPKKLSAGFKRGPDGEVLPNSKDACEPFASCFRAIFGELNQCVAFSDMLVYMRLPDFDISPSSPYSATPPPPPLVAPEPPELALRQVKELDALQKVAMETYKVQ